MPLTLVLIQPQTILDDVGTDSFRGNIIGFTMAIWGLA